MTTAANDLRRIRALRDSGALSWGESLRLISLVTAERDALSVGDRVMFNSDYSPHVFSLPATVKSVDGETCEVFAASGAVVVVSCERVRKLG